MTELVKRNSINAPVKEEIKIIDRREALRGREFGTGTIEPLLHYDLETFRVNRGIISTKIGHTINQKKRFECTLELKKSW